MSNLKTKKEFANKKWTAQDAIYLMEVGAPSGYSEKTMKVISETLGRSMGALKHMMLRIQAGKSKFQDPESNSGVYAKNFEKFVLLEVLTPCLYFFLFFRLIVILLHRETHWLA